jgi:Helix-turn-helix domain
MSGSVTLAAALPQGPGVGLLTTRQVSELFNIPTGTLRYWRTAGLGPIYLKLEGSVRYDFNDVQTYVRKNRHIPSVRANMEERNGIV